MKKLLTVLLAVALVLSMSINVFAAEETSIALTVENYGAYTGTAADALIWGDNSVTAPDNAIISIKLPEPVVEGETVVVHIKGTSDGDFRVWLLGAEEKTCSNQYKMSDHGFTTGEFEVYIELGFTDWDGYGHTSAEELAIKGPSYGTNLTNTKLDYVGITKGTMADVEGDIAAAAQPEIDAAQALVDAVKSVDVTDQAALDAAVAAAQAAIDSIADFGLPALITAKADLQTGVDNVLGEVLLEGFQPQIDAVNAALETAKGAGNDVTAIKAAYDEALAAIAIMEESDLPIISEKVKELKTVVNEIKELHKAATTANAEAKAAEEAAKKEAEEKAAAEAKAAEEKAAKTATTLTIVGIVVAVIVVVAVVLVVLKKKKK